MTRPSLALCLALAAGPATAQSSAFEYPRAGTMPPQIAAEHGEPGDVGSTGWRNGAGAAQQQVQPGAGDGGAGPAGSGSTATGRTTATSGPAGSATEALARQSWGQKAIEEAENRGVNPEVVGAVARAESNFQNVDTAGRTSTATGAFQILQGTWQEAVQKAGLSYGEADRRNPEAQAVVGPALVEQYGRATSNGLGRSATGAELYASWMYGPEAGRSIAKASADTPMDTIVGARALANNRQSSFTVGDYRAFAQRRLGSAANQSVFTTPGS